MISKVVLIVLIEVISIQFIRTNESTKKPKSFDAINSENNTSIHKTNSSINEFFGSEQKNNKKLNNESKIEFNESNRNNKYQDTTKIPQQSSNSSDSERISNLLKNNPRLRLLAEQNPEITKQIINNPWLLRNPIIANAIRSQLGDENKDLSNLLTKGLKDESPKNLSDINQQNQHDGPKETDKEEDQDYDYGIGDEDYGPEEEEEGSAESDEPKTAQRAQESPQTTLSTDSVNKPNLKYSPELEENRPLKDSGVKYDDDIEVNQVKPNPPLISSIAQVQPRYKNQEPVQQHLSSTQGLYNNNNNNPGVRQGYGQHLQQPIQYYPQQYDPNYFGQQFVVQQHPQQQQYPQYPQQYASHPQYLPQHNVHQPIYQQQQGYPGQQPFYNQYPQGLNGGGNQHGYNNNNNVHQIQPNGGIGSDPNLANHNFNSIRKF